jgi:hypothetical protein
MKPNPFTPDGGLEPQVSGPYYGSEALRHNTEEAMRCLRSTQSLDRLMTLGTIGTSVIIAIAAILKWL